MNPRVFSPYRSIGPLGSREHAGVPFLGSGPYELLPGVFRIVPSGSSAVVRAITNPASPSAVTSARAIRGSDPDRQAQHGPP
jgi:hypothetical protein